MMRRTAPTRNANNTAVRENVPVLSAETIQERVNAAAVGQLVTVQWRPKGTRSPRESRAQKERNDEYYRWRVWFGHVIQMLGPITTTADGQAFARTCMVAWHAGEDRQQFAGTDASNNHVTLLPSTAMSIDIAELRFAPPPAAASSSGASDDARPSTMTQRLHTSRSVRRHLSQDSHRRSGSLPPVLGELQAQLATVTASVNALTAAFNSPARLVPFPPMPASPLPLNPAVASPLTPLQVNTASLPASGALPAAAGEVHQQPAAAPSTSTAAAAARTVSVDLATPAPAPAGAGIAPSTDPVRRVRRTIATEADPNEHILNEMFKCPGCEDFACVDVDGRNRKQKWNAVDTMLRSRRRGHVPPSFTGWLERHELLLSRPVECLHNKNGTVCTSTKFWLRQKKSTVNWQCNNKKCGQYHKARQPTWSAPPLDERNAVEIDRVDDHGRSQREEVLEREATGNLWGELYVIFVLLPRRGILHNASVHVPVYSAKMCRALVASLSRTALVENAERRHEIEHEGGWQNCQWDETFVGKRKFQRGHRVRHNGVMTFVGGVTMVDTANGPRIAEGIVASVPAKARDQQIGLLLGITRPSSTIVTDSAQMYAGLKDSGRQHHTVNHRREFVSDTGMHTNAVEGFWAVLKRLMNRYFARGTNDLDTALRFQLCCYMANAHFAGFSSVQASLMLYRAHLRHGRDPAPLYAFRYRAERGVFAMPEAATTEEATAVERQVAAFVDSAVDAENLFLDELRDAFERDANGVQVPSRESSLLPEGLELDEPMFDLYSDSSLGVGASDLSSVRSPSNASELRLPARRARESDELDRPATRGTQQQWLAAREAEEMDYFADVYDAMEAEAAEAAANAVYEWEYDDDWYRQNTSLSRAPREDDDIPSD